MIGMFTGYYQHNSSLDQYDTFTNCNSDGLIRDTTRTSLMGGICGKTTENVLFLQCVNNTIIRNANIAGGILGFCSSSNTDPESALTNDTQLYSCQNNAEITGAHIGGILGMSGYASSTWSAVIDKCTNTGNLHAYQNAGGILMQGCVLHYSQTATIPVQFPRLQTLHRTNTQTSLVAQTNRSMD